MKNENINYSSNKVDKNCNKYKVVKKKDRKIKIKTVAIIKFYNNNNDDDDEYYNNNINKY